MKKMRQDERRARTRRLLLAAARRAFAERGYEAASLDAIAASAGLSKGAVYAHFPTKLDLFLAVAEEELERATAASERVATALQRGVRVDVAAQQYDAGEEDTCHAPLMLQLWAVAAREVRVRELLDAFLAARATLLAGAAVAAGEAPAEAMMRGETATRLIDAGYLHAMYRRAALLSEERKGA